MENLLCEVERIFYSGRSNSMTSQDNSISLLFYTHAPTQYFSQRRGMLSIESSHTPPTKEEGKAEEGNLLIPQPIKHYVHRRHHSLVSSFIGTRINVR
jgi:hypothetical protein